MTIVELMVSMAIGLFVVFASTTLLLSSKSVYMAQDEGARLQETGRYALETIARSVRQAAYENWGKDDAPFRASAVATPNVVGFDAKSLKESTEGVDSPTNTAINGSDVLALRFFGSGAGEHGDGTVLNCAGFGVPEPSSPAAADDERGWSIFYVAKGNAGEPELYCKYRGKKSFTAGAVASGVESFQVLYGVDTDGDGLPNGYLTATAIEALDNKLVLDGPNAVARALDRNRKTHWKQVVAVRVALLLRGATGMASPGPAMQYDLFGKEYGDTRAAIDEGTRIDTSRLPAAIRNRMRKVFSQTIWLRNRPAGDAA